MPWKTWREKRLAEESSARSWREAASEGSYFLAVGLALIICVVGALLATTVGIDYLAGWIVGLLAKPPAPALIGAGTILFAGWGLIRIGTGHAQPGTSRRDKIIVAVLLAVGAVIGVAVAVAAIPQR